MKTVRSFMQVLTAFITDTVILQRWEENEEKEPHTPEPP